MHYITASDGCAALEVLEDLVITPTRPALATSCDIGVSASSWGVGERAARHPGDATEGVVRDDSAREAHLRRRPIARPRLFANRSGTQTRGAVFAPVHLLFTT